MSNDDEGHSKQPNSGPKLRSEKIRENHKILFREIHDEGHIVCQKESINDREIVESLVISPENKIKYIFQPKTNEIMYSDKSGSESNMANDNPLLSGNSKGDKPKKAVREIIIGNPENEMFFQSKKTTKPNEKSEMAKKLDRMKLKKKNEKDKKAGYNHSISIQSIKSGLALERLKKKADGIVEEDSQSSEDQSMEIDKKKGEKSKEEKNTRKRKRDGTHDSTDDPASKRQKATIMALLDFNVKKYTANKEEYEVVKLVKGDKTIRIDNCKDFRKVIWRYGITQKDIKEKMSDLGISEDDYVLENVTDVVATEEKAAPDVDKSDTWDYRRRNKIYGTTYMNSILDMIKVSFMCQTQLKDGTFPYCFGRSLPAFCIVQQKMVTSKNERTGKTSSQLNYEINIPSQKYWNKVLSQSFDVWTEDSAKNKLGKEDAEGKKLQLRMIEKAARDLSLQNGFRLSKGTYDIIYYGPRNVLSCLRECNAFMYDPNELICRKFMEKLDNKNFVITTSQAKPCTSLFSPNFKEAKAAHQDAVAVWEKTEEEIKSGEEQELTLEDIGEKPDLSKYLEISLYNKLCKADAKKQLPFDPWVDFLERKICPWFSLDNKHFMMKRLLQQNESNPATRIRSTNFTSLEELKDANEWTLIGGSMGEEYEPILRLIQHTVQQQRSERAARDKTFKKAMMTIADEIKDLRINETLAKIRQVKQEACQNLMSNRMKEISDTLRANGLTGDKSIYSLEDNQAVTLGANPSRTDILEIQKVKIKAENHYNSKDGKNMFRSNEFIDNGSSISDDKAFVINEMIEIQDKKTNFTGRSYGQKLIASERNLTSAIAGNTAGEQIKFHVNNCKKIEKIMNQQYKTITEDGKISLYNTSHELNIILDNPDIEIVGGSSKVPTSAVSIPNTLQFNDLEEPESAESDDDDDKFQNRMNEEVTVDLFSRHPSRLAESDTITNLSIQMRDFNASSTEEKGINEQEMSGKTDVLMVDNNSEDDLLSSIDRLRDRLSAKDFSPAKSERPKSIIQQSNPMPSPIPANPRITKKKTTLFDMGFHRKRAISEGDDSVFLEESNTTKTSTIRERKYSEPYMGTPCRRSRRLIKPITNFSTPSRIQPTENQIAPKTPKRVKRTTKKSTNDQISFMDDWTEVTNNEKEQSHIDKTWREMYLENIEEKLLQDSAASEEDLNKIVGLKLLNLEEKNAAFKDGFLWIDDPEKKGELTWKKQLLVKNAVQSLRCIRRNDSHIQWTCMLFARQRVVKIILNAMYVECTQRCNLPLAGEIKMILDYIDEKSNAYDDSLFWKEIFTVSDAEAEDRELVRKKWTRMGREVPHVSLTCFYGVRKLMYALVNAGVVNKLVAKDEVELFQRLREKYFRRLQLGLVRNSLERKKIRIETIGQDSLIESGRAYMCENQFLQGEEFQDRIDKAHKRSISFLSSGDYLVNKTHLKNDHYFMNFKLNKTKDKINPQPLYKEKLERYADFQMKLPKGKFNNFEMLIHPDSLKQSFRLPGIRNACINVNGKTYPIPLPDQKQKIDNSPNDGRQSPIENPLEADKSKIKILYSNFNAPIGRKIDKALLWHPDADVIIISEMECEERFIKDGTVVPIGFRAFHHESLEIEHKGKLRNMVLSMILIKECWAAKVELIYDKSTITSVFVRHENARFSITAFYYPIESSNKWEVLGGQELFNEHFDRLFSRIGDTKAVMAGDLNANIRHHSGKFQARYIPNLRSRMSNWSFHQKDFTNETRLQNGKISRKIIDMVATKNLKVLGYRQESGKKTINNNGHVLCSFLIEVDAKMILGTKKIIKREKYDLRDLKHILELTNDEFWANYNALKLQDQLEIQFNDNIGVCKSSKYYFNHLENVFRILNNEKEVEISIKNCIYRQSNITKGLDNMRKAIYRTQKQAENEEDKEEMGLMLKEVQKTLQASMEHDRRACRRTEIKPGQFSLTNLFEVYHLVAPKDRINAGRDDPFSANQLKDSFINLYEGIIAHTKDQKNTFDICDWMVVPESKFNFDDQNLPDWDHMIGELKSVEKIFRSLKPSTKGYLSNLDRDSCAMLPEFYIREMYETTKIALKKCCFEDAFLTTKMVSILKKGDPLLIKNRRYINVGQMQQQFLMKVVAICILVYAEKNNLLGKKQYGFRSAMGCDSAVATFMYKVATIHRDSAATMVCLDLSSAFFCVTHNNLKNLFQRIIDEKAKPFFMKLLEQRKAVLYAKGETTEEFNIPQVGTAQGEATSPIFFILIMSGCLRYALNQIVSSQKSGSDATMFADDMQILNWSNNAITLINSTFDITKKVMEYCSNCGFKVNNGKSEIITFGNPIIKARIENPFMSPAGPIQLKKVINMLGIRFNDKLEFKDQIKHILDKLDWHTSNIHRLQDLGLKNHILKVLFSVCFGSFNFGLGLMPWWGQQKYKEAQTKLNRAIRRICNLKMLDGHHVPQRMMLRLVDILPFHLQHKRMALLFLNRIMKNEKPDDLYDIIISHLDIPEGWKTRMKPTKEHELNGDGPFIKSNSEHSIHSNQSTLKRIFPVSCKDWFNNLPWDIRYCLGSKKFDYKVLNHFKECCHHPVDKKPENCSECRFKTDFANIDLNTLIENVQLEYNNCITSTKAYDNQIISLQLLIDCILLKVTNQEDVFINDSNWSYAERSIDNAF